MKRIKYISPIEEMSGNLSGAQNLKYPTKDNKAFESPEGSVNYARNYKNRFIGAVRRKDGMCYFSVKTKTATHITPRSLMAMALLGGTGAMYAALVRTKASATYAGIYAQWVELQNIGETRSFREFVMDAFRRMLASKEPKVVFTGPRPGAITVNNPWTGGTNDDITISREILAKFWPQLAPNGVTFTIDGIKVLSEIGFVFEDAIAIAENQPLNLSKNEQDYILMGGRYVVTANGEHITADDTAVPNAKYYTTDIAPE